MTLEQLGSLTNDELCMVLYIVNRLSPVDSIPEIPERGLTWFRPGVLEKKIADSFNHVKPEHHPTYSSLLTKLGVPHEIKYEQPPSGSNA